LETESSKASKGYELVCKGGKIESAILTINNQGNKQKIVPFIVLNFLVP
jgi:hypothetical protein